MSKKREAELAQLYQKSQLENAGLLNMLDILIKDKNSVKFNPRAVNFAKYKQKLMAQDGILNSNRYELDNIDLPVRSNQIEYLMYSEGATCMFRENGKLFITKFSLAGQLNSLGNLIDIRPIDFAGKPHGIYKGVLLTNNEEPKVTDRVAVIVQDYTASFINGLIPSRRTINEMTTVADQIKVYNQLANALKITAKKAFALARDENQAKTIRESVSKIFDSDDPIAVITSGGYDELFQTFNLDTAFNIEPYMQAIECYERQRMNFAGVPSKNPYEKRERALTGELADDSVFVKIILHDGLMNRQGSLNLAKKYGIVKENATWEYSKPISEWLKKDNSTQVENKGDNNANNPTKTNLS